MSTVVNNLIHKTERKLFKDRKERYLLRLKGKISLASLSLSPVTRSVYSKTYLVKHMREKEIPSREREKGSENTFGGRKEKNH